MRFVQLICLLICLIASLNVHAQRELPIPEPLEQWRAWVLHDDATFNCPLSQARAKGRDGYQCIWPGTLTIAIDRNGAVFSQAVSVLATDTRFVLPGNSQYWPQDVQVNGRPFPVTDTGSVPAVELPPGEHRINGALMWQQRPAQLAIPSATGLIDLTIDGKRVQRADRTANSLWLARRNTQQANAQDNIDTVVHRLVRDDMPTRLLTRITLDVSGSVRETALGNVLPAGFVPVQLSSDLPVQLESDGNLRVQVRPGTWTINLTARSNTVADAITFAGAGQNMPDTEIWSYSSNNVLRVTTPEGLTPVDPAQTDVPDPWQNLPAFSAAPGDTLTIEERSRGKTAGDNRLTLQRTLWRDFDGGGFTFVDAINGTMTRDWRLDMSGPYQLQGAQAGGDDLLVTVAGDHVGIELRETNVNLSASGRVSQQTTLPINGWLTRFDNVQLAVNLPTGARLLAVPGADFAGGTWMAQWQLLDFFLLLITTVAAARVFGRVVGALAFLTLLISIHETLAPTFIWLNLLVAAALVKVAPEGRLQTLVSGYQRLSLVALAFIVIPFVLMQMRAAIYPDLDPLGSRFYQAQQVPESALASRSLDLVKTREPTVEDETAVRALGSQQVTGARLANKVFERYASDALVPVGPGVPAWSQVSYNIRWSSPVSADQAMQLVIMPRWMVRIWRLLMVALVGGLAAVFVLDALKQLPVRRWLTPGATTAASWFMIIAIGASAPAPAVAQDFPPAEMLEQLRERLTEPPECAPACASITRAAVTLNRTTLSVRLQIDARSRTAVSLPGSLDGWRPATILINGKSAQRAYRDNAGNLNILVDAGVATVLVSGPVPAQTSFTVPFPLRPKLVSIDASDDWYVAGINRQQLGDGALQLTRQQTAEDAGDRWSPSQFPAYVRVERQIALDLDWSVVTTVTRVSPASGAFTAQIALLPGEQVATENVRINNDTHTATIGFSDRSNAVTWRSKLPRTSPLSLTATGNDSYHEVWSAQIGSAWRVSFDGVPESRADERGATFRTAMFYPRPGESLMIAADRPAATDGSTLVFDSVNVNTDIGQRVRSTVLELNYRATRGTQHNIALPDGANVTQVLMDGVASPLRAEAGTLSVPVLPGAHSIAISWQQDITIGLRSAAPQIGLGAAASNINTRIELPRERWVIAVGGDGQGPVILYWSALASLLLLAAVLSRIPLTPLSIVQWLLLGLGFSVFSWPTFFLIAVWLLLLGSKTLWQPTRTYTLYNLVQFVLCGLTVVTLLSTVGALSMGLLSGPDMSITGNGSYAGSFAWFKDLSDGMLPGASVVSLPGWTFKALILVWALWLSLALLRWLPWAWQRLNDGGLWRSKTPLPEVE